MEGGVGEGGTESELSPLTFPTSSVLVRFCAQFRVYRVIHDIALWFANVIFCDFPFFKHSILRDLIFKIHEGRSNKRFALIHKHLLLAMRLSDVCECLLFLK